MQREQAIVLSSAVYGATGLIIHLLTGGGKIPAIVQGLDARNSQNKRADFQTGSYIELELYEPKKQGGLYRVKESRILTAFDAIQTNAAKKSALLFICELTDICITEQGEDRQIFDFIRGSISAMENSGDEHFLLKFVFSLTSFLGFEPNEDCRCTSSYFDMMAAEYVLQKPQHNYYLPMNFADMFFSLGRDGSPVLSGKQKAELWHILNTYYKLHVDNFHVPISFELIK